MERAWPVPWRKLKNRLNNTDCMDVDSGRVLFKDKRNGEKKIDWLVYTEAIWDTIRTYTGQKQDGTEINFVTCVNQRYKQKAGDAAAQNEMEERGLNDSESSRRNLLATLKMWKEAKALYERTHSNALGESEYLEAWRKELKEKNPKLRKKDIEILERMIFEEGVRFLGEPVSEENDDDTLEDMQSDKRNSYKEVLDGMENFLRSIRENWEIVMSAGGLKTQQAIVPFLTRDILRVLKTMDGETPYPMEPAGNCEAYDYMKPQGKFLYEKIFYEKYLEEAFLKMPEDFYEVYVRMLREGFDFSDKFLEELEGKDKSTIWRRRKRYLKWMRIFREYYMEAV